VDEGRAGAVAIRAKKQTEYSCSAGSDDRLQGFGTFKFPETYIVDRRGVVKFKAIGPREWTAPANMNVIRGLIEAK
jgi:hypothetical protein